MGIEVFKVGFLLGAIFCCNDLGIKSSDLAGWSTWRIGKYVENRIIKLLYPWVVHIADGKKVNAVPRALVLKEKFQDLKVFLWSYFDGGSTHGTGSLEKYPICKKSNIR